jgi:hypothetical protein
MSSTQKYFIDDLQLELVVTEPSIRISTPKPAPGPRHGHVPSNEFSEVAEDTYSLTLHHPSRIDSPIVVAHALYLHLKPTLLSAIVFPNDASNATLLQQRTSKTTQSGMEVFADLIRQCLPVNLICPDFLLWMLPILQFALSTHISIDFAPLASSTPTTKTTPFDMNINNHGQFLYQLNFGLQTTTSEASDHTEAITIYAGAGAGAGAGVGAEEVDVTAMKPASGRKSMMACVAQTTPLFADNRRSEMFTEQPRTPEHIETRADTASTTPVLPTVDATTVTLVNIPNCVNVSVMLSLVCGNLVTLVIDTAGLPRDTVVLPPMPKLETCTVGINCSGNVNVGHLSSHTNLSLAATRTTLASVLQTIADSPVKTVQLQLSGHALIIPPETMHEWKTRKINVSIYVNPQPVQVYQESMTIQDLSAFGPMSIHTHVTERCGLPEDVASSLCRTRETINSTECDARLFMYRFK